MNQSAQAWNYTNIFWISLVHLLALAAIPFFSWSALALALIGLFVIAPLGINVGYHRLLTHKSFTAPRWVRNSLVTLGTVSAGGPPIHWAAMHRVHHRYSDSALDPHNSTKGFWYSHVLHLFVEDAHEVGQDHLATYAPDLMKEPYLRFLNRYGTWLAVATLPALFLLGGWPWLLWGGFFRVALTWHVMWLVNSASHMWGYRNYQTADKTVNCWWVGVLAAGEGWHNNHHAFPAGAAHGHRWWEFDLSFFIIRVLEFLGLASAIKRPDLAGRAASSV
jgi:stearoyl-CoA desaturase (delta-9 desaturase)